MKIIQFQRRLMEILEQATDKDRASKICDVFITTLVLWVVFKNLCHSFNINAQALRRDTLCPIHLISMKPLKTYRQEKT